MIFSYALHINAVHHTGPCEINVESLLSWLSKPDAHSRKSVHMTVFLTHKQNIISQVQKSEMLLDKNSQDQKDGEFNPPCPPKP